jgi:hypothetical protein
MTGGHDKFYDRREASFDKLRTALLQGGAFERCLEQYPDLKFEELEDEISGLLETASQKDRMELNFKLGLLRSLRYSVAGSRHCLVLGGVGGLRELYEGKRLVAPLKTLKS